MSGAHKTAAKTRVAKKPARSDDVDPAVELILIPGSSLYQPSLPGKGEKLYFLRWQTTSPPPTLSLDDTWANSGEPTQPGYLLFFSALFDASKSGSVEDQLRKLLSSPTSTRIAWVNYDIASGKVTLSTLVKTKLDSNNVPVVDGETPVNVERGVETVIFPDGALLQGDYNAEGLSQVVSTYSPALSTRKPNGTGVALPLAGGPGGKLVGCLSFLGLTNALDRQPPNRVLKSLMQVAMDPLNPFDTSRNYQIFTGANYFLVENGGGYQLLPAN